MSDSFTNYNYVENTKVRVSVSIKKTYANKCTLSEIFLTEILKSFSVGQVIQNYSVQFAC